MQLSVLVFRNVRLMESRLLPCHVVQTLGHFGVLGPQLGLTDFQAALIEQLGLSVLPHVVVQTDQII